MNHQIDDGEHGLEARRHVFRRRDNVRNPRVSNLALRADQALRHGCRSRQESARDFVGIEAAEGAQREGHLRFERQSGMAAGEDQAEPIVGDFVRVIIRFLRLGDQSGGGVGRQLFPVASLAADAVDDLVAGGLYDPGPGKIGDACLGPLVHGGGKGLLGALFGKVKIAHQANQGGHDEAPIGAVNCLDGRRCFGRHIPMINI